MRVPFFHRIVGIGVDIHAILTSDRTIIGPERIRAGYGLALASTTT
ncbi:hypothetical protein [Nocardia vaccinii]|nr:hypothetical protein [Nocardia vaccinii]